MKECRFCNNEKVLIKAHIFPRCFYSKDGSILYKSGARFPKKRLVGEYDANILCDECDNFLGKLDGYSKSILLDKKGVEKFHFLDTKTGEKKSGYRLIDKDGYDKLSIFFISVLWRCSISSYFPTVDLNQYEDLARKAILRKINFQEYFSIALCYFENEDGPIFLAPDRRRLKGVNTWIFIMGCVKVFIRCDKQKWKNPLDFLFLSSENNILMIETRFNRLSEFDKLKEHFFSFDRNKNS